MMRHLSHDLRYAVRQLRRSPTFTVVAALTLALGIGATTAVFSVVDAVLLRALPYPEPSRLLMLYGARPATDQFPATTDNPASYINFLDWQAQNTVFERMMLFRRRQFNAAAAAVGPERLRGALVSADFFSTLGVAPVLGRTFLSGEDQPGQDGVVVVSRWYWQHQLGGSREAIGRPVRVDGVPLTVIGVVPEGFAQLADLHLWVPMSHDARELLDERGLNGYTAIGRLRPGVTLDRAQREMSAIAAHLAEAYPEDNEGWGLRLVPLQEELVRDIRPTLFLLLGASAVVLLVAAVNVANMLLARATGRQREMALRRALGAGERRLVAQLATESLLLAGVGGVLGLLVSGWGIDALQAVWTAGEGSMPAAVVDWRALLFAAGAACATALIFGLAPALHAARGDLSQSLRQSGISAGHGSRRGARRLLVAGEVALALMLAVGGSLMVRSLIRLQAVDPGFDPEGVLTARVALSPTAYPDTQRIVGFYDRLLSRASALPGVVAVGATDALPLSGSGGRYAFAIEGRLEVSPQQRPNAWTTSITTGYLSALKIPLLAGRNFNDRDIPGAPPVAIVNQSMAQQFWPHGDPVGARVSFTPEKDEWIQVVGVVGDAHQQGLDRDVRPQVFVPFPQSGDRALSVILRTTGDPMMLVRPLREIVAGLDPEIPLAEVRTMEEAVGLTFAAQRVRTGFVGGFASIALFLAGIGIYGVMAYLVAQSGREIAVRMALGAKDTDVLAGVVGQSLRLALPGLVIGIGGTLAFSKLLRGFLYQTAPTDPITYIAVAMATVVLVILATLLPARRAARLDPMTVLRSE
jgi:putative ABC transport system permease protein